MRWIALLLLALGTSQALFAEPTGIERLIFGYGLRESPEPVAKRAGWRRPARIVVDAGMPELVAGLREVAPGVEIVAARSMAEMAAAVAGERMLSVVDLQREY